MEYESSNDSHTSGVKTLDLLVARLLSPFFGSFWWVREQLLIDLLREDAVAYDEKSDRKCHPHVSLLAEGERVGRGFVPFLLGSSRRSGNGCVRIRGLLEHEPERVTYFGGMAHPVRVSSRAMLSRAEDADRNQLTGHPWERSNVWPNWNRLEATDAEKQAIREWCDEWGFGDG